jgi:hypothetical protein
MGRLTGPTYYHPYKDYDGDKGISSGPTETGDTNGPSWSVCVGAQTENGSRFGPLGRRARWDDASCPRWLFLVISNSKGMKIGAI